MDVCDDAFLPCDFPFKPKNTSFFDIPLNVVSASLSLLFCVKRFLPFTFNYATLYIASLEFLKFIAKLKLKLKENVWKQNKMNNYFEINNLRE